MRYRNVHLFVIDGQNDFCADGNEPDDWPKRAGHVKGEPGSLCVTGASQEAQTLANMITDSIQGHQSYFSHIHATLDSHHRLDCSFNTTWKDRNGNTPNPFTIVTHQDIVDHKYTPIFHKGYFEKTMSPHDWALTYTKKLEEAQRNLLCLWPRHCEIGKWGQQPYQPLINAYDTWCEATGRFIDWILKGQWPYVEHYSPWQADVIDRSRQETNINGHTLSTTENADLIVYGGWAGSHCLLWAGKDGVNFFNPKPEDAAKGAVNEYIKKCVFLKDASAPVPNPPGPNAPDFEQWRLDFLDEMVNRGGRVMDCADLQKELRG